MNSAVLISLIVVAVLVVLFLLYVLTTYKALVGLRARVDEAWSDIDSQVARRAELMPKLTDTVAAYATHDRAVLDSVATARDESVRASGPAEATVAANHVQQALRSLYSVAEAYPQLQASPNFLQLQGDLGDTEEKIQASRRFYNGGVRELNTRIQVFPNSLFARRLGFGARDFFEVADGAAIAEPPRIQF